MANTKETINLEGKNINNNTPARAMRTWKIVMDTSAQSPWINKEFFAIVNFQWNSNVALTVQFKGRYRADDGDVTEGECLIGDKDGVPITLDLSQGHATLGSTFPVDLAAPFDEISFVLSGNDSGTYYFGLAG